VPGQVHHDIVVGMPLGLEGESPQRRLQAGRVQVDSQIVDLIAEPIPEQRHHGGLVAEQLRDVQLGLFPVGRDDAREQEPGARGRIACVTRHCGSSARSRASARAMPVSVAVR
jgi:hypothetical protein